ncbi:putative Proteasome subunit alpha type-2-like 18, partial [Homarus americanus]
MRMWRCVVYVCLVMVVRKGAEGVPKPGYLTEEGGVVSVAVKRIMTDYLAGCHLVIVSTTQHSPLDLNPTRTVYGGEVWRGVQAVDAVSLFTQDEADQQYLLQALLGDAYTLCHALVLDLTNNTLALRFLEASRVWRDSDTSVILAGKTRGALDVLLHPGLRNTLRALCVVPDRRRRPLPANT